MTKNFYVLFVVVICLASDTIARPITINIGQIQEAIANGTSDGNKIIPELRAQLGLAIETAGRSNS